MTIAEHVAVFISIVVGIAVGDLLISLHRLLRARDRVQWHWLPLAVALYVLLLTVNYWWLAFGVYGDAGRLSVAGFLPTLAQFVILFLLVAASLPDDVPSEGIDLNAWYFANARLYWTMATISLVLDIIVGGLRAIPPGGGAAELIQAKIVSVALLPFVAAMIFVRRPWYHAGFVALSLGTMVWAIVSIALGA